MAGVARPWMTALVALVCALTASACTSRSDRLLLEQFFSASRLRDRTALARFATVTFEPHIDGIVARFAVAATTPERSRDTGLTATAPSADDRRIALLSLEDPINPIDVGAVRTTLVERDVTVRADVRQPDGSTAVRTIILSLQRARVSRPVERTGRWIVVAFR